MRDEPDASIQMGYGKLSAYPLSWYRAPLVFAGHPYLFDPGSLMDYRRSGREIPRATLDRLRSGRTTLWLIPKGEVPFETDSYYRIHDGTQRQDLFGEEFREVFRGLYEHRGTTRFFDLWRLREEPTTRPGAGGPAPADDRSARAGLPEPPAVRATAASSG